MGLCCPGSNNDKINGALTFNAMNIYDLDQTVLETIYKSYPECLMVGLRGSCSYFRARLPLPDKVPFHDVIPLVTGIGTVRSDMIPTDANGKRALPLSREEKIKLEYSERWKDLIVYIGKCGSLDTCTYVKQWCEGNEISFRDHMIKGAAIAGRIELCRTFVVDWGWGISICDEMFYYGERGGQQRVCKFAKFYIHSNLARENMEPVQYECDCCGEIRPVDQFLIAFDTKEDEWTGIYCVDCISRSHPAYLNHRFFKLVPTTPPAFTS